MPTGDVLIPTAVWPERHKTAILLPGFCIRLQVMDLAELAVDNFYPTYRRKVALNHWPTGHAVNMRPSIRWTRFQEGFFEEQRSQIHDGLFINTELIWRTATRIGEADWSRMVS